MTNGAQAVSDEDMVSPWQTRLWGLGRTLQVENPEQLGGCIDLDPGPSVDNATNLDLLIDELTGSGTETEICVS